MLSLIMIGGILALIGTAVLLLWLVADTAEVDMPLVSEAGFVAIGLGLLVVITGGVGCLVQVIIQSMTT